jgi:phospholipid transport system substrate-binding protein
MKKIFDIFTPLFLRGIFSIISIVAIASAEQSGAAAPSPMQAVQKTIDEVLKVALTLKGDENKTKRREQLREIIAPRFDFSEMAKRSLGASWLKMSTTQQDEFVTVFSSLLGRTYLERVETIEEKMVTIDSENVSMPKALVKTSVHRKGDVFPLDYRLHFQDNQWKVYDVIIENIGLVSNYRNEFSGIIRKDGIDGLISKLKDKEGKTNS